VSKALRKKRGLRYWMQAYIPRASSPSANHGQGGSCLRGVFLSVGESILLAPRHPDDTTISKETQCEDKEEEKEKRERHIYMVCCRLLSGSKSKLSPTPCHVMSLRCMPLPLHHSGISSSRGLESRNNHGILDEDQGRRTTCKRNPYADSLLFHTGRGEKNHDGCLTLQGTRLEIA